MAIKKGDLVEFADSIPVKSLRAVRETLEDHGIKPVFVVIKTPREINYPTAKQDGKIHSSAITVGVDLLFEGKILKEVPIRYLKRVDKLIEE